MTAPRRSLLTLLCLTACAAPAAAQSGFALKGHYLYNASVAEGTDGEIPSADGFSVGAELVLPGGIGVGVSGYATGDPTDFDAETGSVAALAEANYFFRLPLIPIAPYAGVHAGLGRYTGDDLDGGADVASDDGWRQLGVQAGLRLQLGSSLGIDAQFRRVSVSAQRDQDEGLERNQLLVGVTLF